MSARASPWWYQMRGPVIGWIYFLGYGLGALLWVPFTGRYTSVIDAFGERWGGTGIYVALAVASLCTFLCFLIRLSGSSYLRAPVVWSAQARSDSLIVAGPFRFTRNPLYLGNILLSLGFGFLAPPPGFGLIVALNVVFVSMLANVEEVGLRHRYGAEFEEYCRRVPRFIPRMIPVPTSGNAMPSLKSGLCAEIFSLSCFVAMLSFFFAGKSAIVFFYVILTAGFCAQSIAIALSRKG